MLLRQFRLGNNLPTYIKENIDLPWQKPRQLSGAETNFEGCKKANKTSQTYPCIFL